MPWRGHGAPGEAGVLRFHTRPDPRPSWGALCALRDLSPGWWGQVEGPVVGALQAGVTPTQPFSWAHQPGSLGMKLVGPDFPKKGKAISHPKWPAAAKPGRVPTTSPKGPTVAEGTCRPLSAQQPFPLFLAALHLEGGSLGELSA